MVWYSIPIPPLHIDGLGSPNLDGKNYARPFADSRPSVPLHVLDHTSPHVCTSYITPHLTSCIHHELLRLGKYINGDRLSEYPFPTFSANEHPLPTLHRHNTLISDISPSQYHNIHKSPPLLVPYKIHKDLLSLQHRLKYTFHAKTSFLLLCWTIPIPTLLYLSNCPHYPLNRLPSYSYFQSQIKMLYRTILPRTRKPLPLS